MESSTSLAAEADRLEHNAVFAGVLGAVLATLVLLLVHPLMALVAGVILAGGWVLFMRARIASAPDRVLAGLDLDPVVTEERPRLANLLEGLCMTSGVAAPEVFLVESPAMNALVVAGRGGSRLVLTTGLVERLGRLEMEGVIANLLGRVRDGSAHYSTTVLGLFGDSARADALLSRHLGDQRAVMSDMAAVDLTRYPPGLMAALSTMSDAGTVVDGVPPLSAPLWLAPVGKQGADGVDPVGTQPLSLRIAVLAEL